MICVWPEPLDVYYLENYNAIPDSNGQIKFKNRPDFEVENTGCWRGYIGTWRIKDDKLFLIGITGRLNGTEINLKTLFPEAQDEVFAFWYTGLLRCPTGKLLKYVHMGYESIYEKYLLIDVKDGVVTVVKKIKDNHN